MILGQLLSTNTGTLWVKPCTPSFKLTLGIIETKLFPRYLTHSCSLGGIIPPIARDLHAQNIDGVVKTALKNAKLQGAQLDAIAVTVKPGLPLSLSVGVEYAKNLCKKWNKPIIPIHPMEAHALTVRMVEKVATVST